MSLPTIEMAGKKVGRVGYGLMQLTWNPHPPPQEESFAAMKAAADAGATSWSSATFYGPPNDPLANINLIAAFFAKYPEYKSKIVIAVKGGLDSHMAPAIGDELAELCRKELVAAKELLGDKEIDIFIPARINPKAKLEDVLATLKTLQGEGLFGQLGLSEVKGETLERAAKIMPIALLEIEVSLWTYEPWTKAGLASAQKLGIPVFCYSPLGRGFITRKWKTPDDIPDGSFQKMVPRFQGQAFYDNLKLVDQLDELAKKKGVETPQLALAWVVRLSDVTIPIPGSSKPDRVRSNIASATIDLSDSELEGINKILSSFEVAGERYPEMAAGALMY